MTKVKFSNGLVLSNSENTIVEFPKGKIGKYQECLIGILDQYKVSDDTLVGLAKVVNYIEEVIIKGDNATLAQYKRAKEFANKIERALKFAIDKPYQEVELSECNQEAKEKIYSFLKTRSYEDYVKIRAYF